MIVPLEPLSVRKKPHYAIFCILSLYYHLQYFLCEDVSKAINGQLHRLAINSSVIVACFYLQNCTDSQLLGISLHKIDRWQLWGINTKKACIFSIFQWFCAVEINTHNKTTTSTWSYYGAPYFTLMCWRLVVWQQRTKWSQLWDICHGFLLHITLMM